MAGKERREGKWLAFPAVLSRVSFLVSFWLESQEQKHHSKPRLESRDMESYRTGRGSALSLGEEQRVG
jgi:hypothetical protein